MVLWRAVHVYLSFPFILSWSSIEAKACGCCIVGSEGMPVSEVIQDGWKVFYSMNDPKLLQKKLFDFYPIPRLVRLGRAHDGCLLYDQRLTQSTFVLEYVKLSCLLLPFPDTFYLRADILHELCLRVRPFSVGLKPGSSHNL